MATAIGGLTSRLSGGIGIAPVLRLASSRDWPGSAWRWHLTSTIGATRSTARAEHMERRDR
jgi:hypothetical protein